MRFMEYMHIERLGNDKVEGILYGKIYIFPKIDGTNGSVYLQNKQLNAANKRRKLTTDNDNNGFLDHLLSNKLKFLAYFKQYPNHILFMEYLIPHSLTTYRDSAWGKAYVLDVYECINEEHGRYLPYEDYSSIIEQFDIEYIPPLAIINNPESTDLEKYIQRNTYLIKENEGIGEGIVIKNYSFKNRYGETIWAKIVTNEFKDIHRKEQGPDIINRNSIEQIIIEKYCTSQFIDKTFHKIRVENNGWNSDNIPDLFSRSYHDFVTEEIWDIIKDYKKPTIDFKKLYFHMVKRIKNVKSELF